MSSYLITGANRGIGLEMVKQLGALPASQVSTVFAAARSVSEALQKVIDNGDGRVVPVNVQVTDKASIDKAVAAVGEKLAGKGLDVLINNAGIMPFTMGGTEALDVPTFQQAFDINVVAVHNCISSLLPLMRKGKDKKIIAISSTVGSIAMTKQYSFAPAPSYKVTKAAVNSLMVNYATDLEKEGFTIFPVSPGWLKTDLGSDQADLTVDVGVKAVLDIVMSAGPDSNGRFRQINVPGWENNPGPNKYDGKDKPW